MVEKVNLTYAPDKRNGMETRMAISIPIPFHPTKAGPKWFCKQLVFGGGVPSQSSVVLNSCMSQNYRDRKAYFTTRTCSGTTLTTG